MDITHHLKINATPETIYKAVSTEQGMKGWWSKDCTVGESEGENSILKFDKQGTIVKMDFRTESLDLNKKVVWTCIGNGNPMWIDTKIVTEITATDEGCDVVFAHTAFDEKYKGQEGFEMIKQGWEHFVNSLTSFCENGTGQPW